MSILPKTSKEFADKKYWDKFFKQRDSSFEWYGDYSDLKKVFTKFIKPEHSLLIVGCGNSTLSADLYDDGFLDNTSIDISDVVIEKMNSQYKVNGIRQRLRFECMDIFNMSYRDQTFNAIVDKGTLDALCSDDLDLNKMFLEIERVLKPLGRFICVSLLQENVARKLFAWFIERSSWIVQIQRCLIDPKDDSETDSINFPVFVVICTKLKSVNDPNNQMATALQIDLEGEGKFNRVNDLSKLVSTIKAAQDIEFVKFYIRSNKIMDENFFLEIYGKDNLEESRYLIYFVRKPAVNSKNCAVFIVPIGREHEWLFSTTKGRMSLLLKCQVDRLIVVHLCRNQAFESIDKVKDELSSRLTDFFPKGTRNTPFLTLGDEIGEVSVMFKGSSKFSGEYQIEDVTVTKSKVRRLVFLSNRNVIQSEADLKKIQTKNKKRMFVTKEVINNEFLSCDHHKFIAAGLSLPNRIEQKTFNLMIIGLGGGCFVNYLNHNLNLPKDVTLSITAVEIDCEMINVAKKWFDFHSTKKENINITIEIMDGIKFVEQKARNQETFDFIIFDVDSKNLNLGISCPPKEFVEPTFLKQVSHCLNSNGVFILNLVARNEDLKQIVHRSLANIFTKCIPYQMEEDLNEIIFCFNLDQLDWLRLKSSQSRKNHLKTSLFHLNILTATYNKLSDTKLGLL